MIYNFRIDRSARNEILRRLMEEGLLSQGWGGGETGSLRIDEDDYVSKCKTFYDLASTRVPSNLTRMRDFMDGDLIVTPHLPENGKASIHIINGDFPACYDYLAEDSYHLNNRFRIKTSYGLDGSISIYNATLAAWYAKLPWLRLPVLPMPECEAAFRTILQQKEGTPDVKFEPSKLEEYLGGLRAQVLALLRQHLTGVSSSNSEISFEAICEHLLTSAGYRITSRHLYDGMGGDVDLRCIRARADLSPFESGETVLCVQVKKHVGTTDRWAVEQLLKMIEKEPEADACVMSLADGFSEDARELAEKNGVLLMNGQSIARLLLTELAKQSA